LIAKFRAKRNSQAREWWKIPKNLALPTPQESYILWSHMLNNANCIYEQYNI